VAAVGTRWGVENRLPWVLDSTSARMAAPSVRAMRRGISLLTQIVLNLIRLDPTDKTKSQSAYEAQRGCMGW